MSIKTASNRFIDSSFKRYAGFYQHLLNNVANFHVFANRIVKAAEHAQDFRLSEKVEELGSALSSFPTKEHQMIGRYYLGWCAYRKGEDAQTMLEEVVENSDAYRVRALWSLAAVKASKDNYDAELRYLTESMRYIEDPGALIEVRCGIAVVKAKEGYHRQSLRELEGLVPSLRYAQPKVYFGILNSLAVELGEAGKIEQARNICKLVIDSPYAFAYPEWQETAKELGEANRSFVAVDSPAKDAHNVLFMPAPGLYAGGRSADLRRANMPARVFNLHQWKARTTKDADGNQDGDQNRGVISDRQMLLRIVELASTDDLPDDALREMVDVLEKIVATYKRKDA